MRTIRDIPDLTGAKVLMRTDLDVPVDASGQITEEFRIVRQKETLDLLLSRGARVALLAHASDEQIGTFRDLVPQLRRIWGREIAFGSTLRDLAVFAGDSGSLFLLEELRRWHEEKENDAAFASELASGFDFYVNNSFAVSHREHASVSALAFNLPAYAGLVVEKEVAELTKVIDAPARGKVVVLGGAKASTKVPVIDNLITKAEHILLGGVVAIDIMKAMGQDIKNSRADDDIGRLLESLNVHDARLVIHEDSTWDNEGIVDIGPRSIERFSSIIAAASMVIWNGPVGKFEDERFATGTRAVAQAIADSGAFSLIGGGDTIAACRQFGLLDRFSYVSTGGGAMLAFLAGERLPGLVPLGVYST